MSKLRSIVLVPFRFRWAAAGVLAAAAALHCGAGGDGGGGGGPGSPPGAAPGAGPGAGPASDQTAEPAGEVTLALAEVPAEIGCLRVTAAGVDRTAARDFAVTPGQPFTTVLTGVPLGTVAFSAGAYPGSCEEVTASTHPAWISEEEIVAVVLGRQASVSLTLHRNGRAKVTIDFADEPACTATGAACVSSSQCCSRSCSRGTCQDPDAGTEPTAPDASPPDTPES